jgi:2-hydroxychromene-2-carboxylate isomerase
MCDEMPPNFPPLTLHVMRALCAIQHADGHSQERIVKTLDALFHKYWVEKVPTHEPDVLKNVLEEVLGTPEAEKGTSATSYSSICVSRASLTT